MQIMVDIKELGERLGVGIAVLGLTVGAVAAAERIWPTDETARQAAVEACASRLGETVTLSLELSPECRIFTVMQGKVLQDDGKEYFKVPSRSVFEKSQQKNEPSPLLVGAIYIGFVCIVSSGLRHGE